MFDCVSRSEGYLVPDMYRRALQTLFAGGASISCHYSTIIPPMRFVHTAW